VFDPVLEIAQLNNGKYVDTLCGAKRKWMCIDQRGASTVHTALWRVHRYIA